MEKYLAQLPWEERKRLYLKNKEEYEKNPKTFIQNRLLQLMNYICIVDSETFTLMDFERNELLQELKILSTLL